MKRRNRKKRLGEIEEREREIREEMEELKKEREELERAKELSIHALTDGAASVPRWAAHRIYGLNDPFHLPRAPSSLGTGSFKHWHWSDPGSWKAPNPTGWTCIYHGQHVEVSTVRALTSGIDGDSG
ncbi:MAG: hypothetical protein Q9226_009135 [Calogaya cf. arnoldii]